MLELIKKHINMNFNIENKAIICAVSGGVDSICLLHILYNLNYNVVLAHVNHNKRTESKDEEIAMRNLANKLNIPFELLDYHYESNDNFHNDSHNARYLFFKSLCKKYNTDVIATAHHLDDQIETILIKLLEGSNLYGYGGISQINDDGEYKIIRPLLCVNKNQLYKYANDNNLEYFEDKSNQEDVFLRNRIRHNIIPLLKNETDDFYNKINQYSLQLKEAFNFIRNKSIEYLNETDNIIVLDSFNDFDIALKKDILSLLLERYDIKRSTALINDMLKILDISNGTKQISLEKNYVFIRNYNKVYVKKNNYNILEPKEISVDDSVIFNDKYKFYFSKKMPVNNAKYIKLCYNSLELPFYIRNKKDGDFITLKIGNKKVSRIFIDYKIAKDLRDYIPIITDNKGDILWIYNLIKSEEVINQKENGDIYFVCEEI